MKGHGVMYFLLVLFSILSCSPGREVQEQRNENLITAVEEHRYVFRARAAQPLRGRTIQLNSVYDLRVTKDSVIAFLPYFGRSYTAPIDPTAGGINFTSTDFEYHQAAGDRGGWTIEIKPNDAQGVRQLFLSISEGGNGSLQVTSNNRQSISFTGTVLPIK